MPNTDASFLREVSERDRAALADADRVSFMTQCIVDVTVVVDNEKASDEADHLPTSSDAAAGCESKATCTQDL